MTTCLRNIAQDGQRSTETKRCQIIDKKASVDPHTKATVPDQMYLARRRHDNDLTKALPSRTSNVKRGVAIFARERALLTPAVFSHVRITTASSVATVDASVRFAKHPHQYQPSSKGALLTANRPFSVIDAYTKKVRTYINPFNVGLTLCVSIEQAKGAEILLTSLVIAP